MRLTAVRCTLSLLVVLAAGCGTTVPQASQTRTTGDGMTGSTNPELTGGGVNAPDEADSPVPGGLTPGAGTQGVPNTGSGGSGVTRDGASSAAPRTSAVESRAPVKVGVVVPSSSAKSDSAAMGFALDFGDPRAMAKAMGNWVNAHGGLHGHPITLVVDEDSSTSTIAQNDATHCAKFTQDNHVAAAVTATINGVGLPQCLGRAGAGLFGSGVTVLRSDDLRRAGAQWSPYLLNGERLFTQLLTRLKATGWLAVPAGEHIGILYTDDGTTFTPLAQLVKAKAQAMGVPITATAGVATGDSAGYGNAVLRFKNQNITRVISVGLGAALQITFSKFAESQAYYPRYSFTSVDVPGTSQSLMSPQSMKGAAGIGWVPTSDLAKDQLPPPNAAGRLCSQIYAKAGVKVDTPLAVALADAYCDGFLFLHTVYSRAGGLSLTDVRQAIVEMGTSYTSAVTSATSWGAGNFDGAVQTRDLTYSTACSCLVYSKAALSTVPS